MRPSGPRVLNTPRSLVVNLEVPTSVFPPGPGFNSRRGDLWPTRPEGFFSVEGVFGQSREPSRERARKHLDP